MYHMGSHYNLERKRKRTLKVKCEKCDLEIMDVQTIFTCVNNFKVLAKTMTYAPSITL